MVVSSHSAGREGKDLGVLGVAELIFGMRVVVVMMVVVEVAVAVRMLLQLDVLIFGMWVDVVMMVGVVVVRMLLQLPDAAES
jgi:hypothetical protein